MIWTHLLLNGVIVRQNCFFQFKHKGGKSMGHITTLGIDLAKNIFELCGLDKDGGVIYRRTVRRSALVHTVAKLSIKIIAMEACGGSHHWYRTFSALGLEVKLICPEYVKPFVKGQKNDRNDAEGIATAAMQKNMRFVPPKTLEQQDIQSLLRIRERLVHNRTQLINEVRGLLQEYGITLNRGVNYFKKELPALLRQDPIPLTEIMRRAVNRLYTEYLNLEDEIERYEQELTGLFKQSEDCQRLATIPGVGLLSALATMAQAGDISYFKNARHFSAYLGLVPKQHSSGGRVKLSGISKRGDSYLRTLLIHGARSVLRRVDRREDRRSQWLQKLRDRIGYNKACVALANKQARTIWAVLTRKETYQLNHVSEWGKVYAV
jgi:transposase